MRRVVAAVVIALSVTLWGTLAMAAEAGASTAARAAPQTGPAAAPGMQAATATVQVEQNVAQAEFGADIRFILRALAEEPIRSVMLLYQIDDSPVQNSATPTYTPGGVSVAAAYIWRVGGVLLPGTEVKYQWQVETASGKTTTTKEQSVAYYDSRFTWREAAAQGEPLTVYHQQADSQAGQTVVDEARKALQRLRSDYGLTLDKPLRVYAYTRQQDYVSALMAVRPTEAALATGVDRVFVLAPAGTANMTMAMQQLRREVAHAVFLQKTENPYAQPPLWLSDGFGRFISGEEISQQNYKTLGQMAQANQLLPLRTLNSSYPNTEQGRILASFQSLSATKFVAETYGPEKFRALLAAIKEGSTTDDAIKKGLGVTLDQLETRWKNALKSGAAARPASGQGSGQTAPVVGDGFLDRMLGPAIQYWQGAFGAYSRPVVLVGAGFIILTIVAIIGSVVLSTIRRARAEEE